MSARIVLASLWRITSGGSPRGTARSSAVGGVQHGGGQYDWRAPANAHEAEVFKAHAAPLGLCDDLVIAVKRLANQQKDGDRPIERVGAGYNRSAVDVGGPRRGTPGR